MHKSFIRIALGLTLIALFCVCSSLAKPVGVKAQIFSATSTPQVSCFNFYEDAYWVAYNATVQQINNSQLWGLGYQIAGDPNWLIQANFTRTAYSFKSQIISVVGSDIILQNTEGKYDLNFTAFRIIDNGSLGEKLASFFIPDQPAFKQPSETRHAATDMGVGINPSILSVGNVWQDVGKVTYRVDRKETLTGTVWVRIKHMFA